MMFHKLCDDIENLIFLIRTEHGKIIGGYNPLTFCSKKRGYWLTD